MAGLVRPPAESVPSSVPSFGQIAETPVGARHWAGVGVGSVLVHLILLLFATGVARLPGPAPVLLPPIELAAKPRVTKLIAPPIDVLTQRSPNKGKLSQEFNLSSLTPRPAQPNVPAQPGAAALPKRSFRLPDKTAPPTPKINVPDAPAPPAIDTAQIHPSIPAPALGNPVAPPPPPPVQDKPKLSFERPGSMNGTPAGIARQPVPRPGTSVEEAARQVMRGGGKGMIVGDEDAGTAGASPTSPSVPIPGKLGSAVELLSDPQGVDFWPYLVKVLTTVRRNWFAVIPESARLGRQGRTVVQFAINRDGSVPKLVIATPSGAESLDRAAVAGISASNPFIPLPPEFKGSQVRLQFVFKYNVK